MYKLQVGQTGHHAPFLLYHGRSGVNERNYEMPAVKEMNFEVGFEAYSQLSDKARSFVQAHPNQARTLILTALEGAAVLDESSSAVEIPAGVPASLKRFFVNDPLNDQADTLTATQAAEELGMARQSVYTWIEQGRLLAWETTKRGKHIPREQILGEGEVVADIKDVLDIIPDPKTAWRFLTEETPFFDTPQRPIDVLKSGDVAAVCAAARSVGEAFS